jgi:hypothetical protein
LGAKDGLARPALHQVEDLGDGLIAQDDRPNLIGAAEAWKRDRCGDGSDRRERSRGGGRSRRRHSRGSLGEAQGRGHGGGDEQAEKGQRGPPFMLGRMGADHWNKGYDLDNTKPEK